MKFKLFHILFLFITLNISGQVHQIAHYNPLNSDPNNPEAPWAKVQGVRTVWAANDMDKDGRQEILATDYSNGGRVHVLELNSANELEIVFSTPVLDDNTDNGSTPRWVRSGDMDGDGNLEFIFPLTINNQDGQVQIWEWNGADNSYGESQEPTVIMEAEKFVIPLGIGRFRTNREVATVYDFDGDGRDELIMANRDNNVYVLGWEGYYPGFGSFNIEGGSPSEVPQPQDFHAGSYWHSIPADVDGDGVKEIMNHYWNYWGLFGIEPNGNDSYTYPQNNVAGNYYEYFYNESYDGVSYMGIYPADVDGNGKDEVVGLSGYSSEMRYKVVLFSLDQGENVLTGLDGSNQFGIISDGLWDLAGLADGSHWGINAADIDLDGKDEIFVGGNAGYNLSMLKYNGTGSVLDQESYDESIIYEGIEGQFYEVSIYDSLGHLDTVRSGSPLVSKIFAGSDMNNNGVQEVVISFQSVADSITYRYYSWDSDDYAYILNNVMQIPSEDPVNIRVLEWGGQQAPAEFFATIYLSDASSRISKNLQFGALATATDGIDPNLGEAELPPVPPAGAFDARFILPDNSLASYKDIRPAGEYKTTWKMTFQPGGGGYPFTFTWDKAELTSGTFKLVDAVTGGSIVNVDMNQESSYTLANSDLNSLLIEYVPLGVPVEMTAFSAKVAGQGVNLNWTTATEINNSGFEIERSSNNKTFKKIAFIEGKGTTSEKQNYSYSDQSVQSGTYYYRLIQIDFDGTRTIGEVKEISFPPRKFSLGQNYPNPFNPSTRIKFSLPVDAKVVMKLYNTLGQEVAELTNGQYDAGIHEVNFNASNISSGVYFYTIEAAGSDGNTFTQVRKMSLIK